MKWQSRVNQWILAVFIVPLSPSEGWQNLKFSKIPANKVSHSTQSIQIRVDKSASPLIYPLAAPVKAKKVEVSGKVSALIRFKEGEKQGEKGLDDYVLRVGLVIPGKKKLNWMQRQMAADWVLKLYSLAPKNSGLDHIYFLNLGQDAELRGRAREHPMTDLIKEKNEWLIKGPGEFQLSAEFEKEKTVSAIWISIDGDDTGSKYTLDLQSLKLISGPEK